MNELTMTFKGWDDWNRPVYESEGRLYCDVDPRKDHAPELCTKCGNDFYGEPDSPVPVGIEITFIPYRATW
jgi:hypothetical protein